MQDVSRHKLRGCFTHIAMICDDASLQPRLPQIFLGNEHIFPPRVIVTMRPDLAKNIVLWRRKSAWVTKSTMVEVVQALAAALGVELKRRRVMLLLDACRIHMGTGFLRACATRGILVHYVPASLTWLMQPLDTHAFSRFKAFIGCHYRQEVMKTGHCKIAAMLRIVADAVRKVLQGVQWSYAFDANGFGQRQTQVRQRILDVLEQHTAVSASFQLPSYQQFAVIFPRRATLPLADLLSFHRRREPGPASGTAQEPVAAPASEAARVSATSPWHGRLRSSSALSIDAGC